MKLKIFSVLDLKSDLFSSPFFSPTQASGVRAFSQACTDPASEFSKFPTDFELFQIGEWDDNTGEIEYTGKESLGLASRYIVSK